MIAIKIDRHNWREFCQEPSLTDEEWQQWYAACFAIRSDERVEDAVFQATDREYEEVVAAERATTDDWADMVVTADACRRFNRATIEAVRVAMQRNNGYQIPLL